MSIDERILRIEQQLKLTVPGTSISRQLAPERGMQWVIGFGQIHMPKEFFTGKTIEEALTCAENKYWSG